MADAQIDSMPSQTVFKEPVSSTEKQVSLKPAFGERNEEVRIMATVEDRQDGQKPSIIEVHKRSSTRDSTRQRVANKKKEVIAEKVTGTVKWFNVKYGYGFISRNDTKEDVFVHQTGIVRNNPNKVMRSVGDGEQVEFSVVAGVKGNEAAYVTGPLGRPVKGSPYVADRRYYRRPAYPQKQLDGTTSGRPGIETQDQKGTQQKYYRRYFRSSPRNRYPKEQNDSSSQPQKEVGKGDEVKAINNAGQAVDDNNADRGDAPVEDLKPTSTAVVEKKLEELECTKMAESQEATELESQDAEGRESIQIYSNVCNEKVRSVDQNDSIEASVLTTENTVFDNSSIITVIEEISISDSINHGPECVK